MNFRMDFGIARLPKNTDTDCNSRASKGDLFTFSNFNKMSFNRAIKDAGLSIRVNSNGGRTVGGNAAMDREENTRFSSERRGKMVLETVVVIKLTAVYLYL